SRKRWTVWTATVRRDTVSRASCRKSSGKVHRAGLGPGIAASFPCRDFLGVHLLLLKVRRNHDVICETDHLETAAFVENRVSARLFGGQSSPLPLTTGDARSLCALPDGEIPVGFDDIYCRSIHETIREELDEVGGNRQ